MRKIVLSLTVAVFMVSCDSKINKNLEPDSVDRAFILMHNAEGYKQMSFAKLKSGDTAEAKICYKIYQHLLFQSDSTISSVANKALSDAAKQMEEEKRLEHVLDQTDSIKLNGMCSAYSTMKESLIGEAFNHAIVSECRNWKK